jgi:hypothetical protein
MKNRCLRCTLLVWRWFELEAALYEGKLYASIVGGRIELCTTPCSNLLFHSLSSCSLCFSCQCDPTVARQTPIIVVDVTTVSQRVHTTVSGVVISLGVTAIEVSMIHHGGFQARLTGMVQAAGKRIMTVVSSRLTAAIPLP